MSNFNDSTSGTSGDFSSMIGASKANVARAVDQSMTPPQLLRREVAVEVIEEGDGRTLVSRLVPYGEIATVDDGDGPYSEEILPGAFDRQTGAAHRIKAFLNIRHRQSFRDEVGHLTKIEDKPDGLHGELRVAPGEDGDKALYFVRAGMLDRLSIEFQPLKSRVVDGVVQRVKARLVGVALVPEGAYAGAAVLAVREDPDDDDDEDLVEEPDQEAEPVPARRTFELPPDPLDAERLERVGVDAHRRAFTSKPWNGSASKYASTEAYCSACLIDDNPSGADKVQGKCHLPIKEPDGTININAVRNALARVGQTQTSSANKAAARRRLQQLMSQFQSKSGGNG